ncbi:acylneuraminate cytidylyltransferase family protein [candidate division KSB3 bacterium]|uniref:Acylneuraminate cytidylyltransferase family protein n=1 Tax=candidate division KSB3 bacterium TaxID=2044937 RepID=A0A9D5Q6S6_9BACT|nr:acylneuraminate cytidylyltransferase family protein [candidate division KSB3 bacterium]MBD3326174.1 acylneuraminate cytidylyltransferase family protein [candidate division KSB3 bacterium]
MIHGNTILVVVPARGGSKGIKLKNIYPLGGKPLLVYTGEVVQHLDYIDRAVVSTDHAEIARVARSCGLDVPFYRPESLSGDRIGDWDVLHHALREIEARDKKTYDIVVMLQPTSPMRKPEHVTRTVETLIQGKYDAVWTVSLTDSKAHPLKQLVMRDGRLDYYDPAGAQIIARQQLTPVYHRNGVAYAITRDCLLEKHSIKGDTTGVVIIDEPLANIDTAFDVRLAEFLLTQQKP